MNDRTPRTGLLDRLITLRWALIFLAIAILGGLAISVRESVQARRQQAMYRSVIKAQSTQSAEAIARTIATFGNAQIVDSNWTDLQQYADEVVANSRVTYVAIANRAGVAVVHTNRSFRGKLIAETKDTAQVVHASVPAMSRTRQVATVWVALNTGEAPEGDTQSQ